MKDIVFTVLEKSVNMDIIKNQLHIETNSTVKKAELAENIAGNLTLFLLWKYCRKSNILSTVKILPGNL